MVIKQIMQIGEKIEVVMHNNSKSENRVYFSMVQDIPQEDEIIITLPVFKGRPVVLNLGQEVKINFFRESGQFYFIAEVTDRMESDSVRLVKLKQTSPVYRLQRRNFYRLRIRMPVLITTVEENLQQNEVGYTKAYTVDISGGGIRILTNCELKPGQRVECAITLTEKQKLKVDGLVVRSTASLSEGYKYDVGIKFTEILEAERDKIIQFIFEQQRKFRNKDFM